MIGVSTRGRGELTELRAQSCYDACFHALGVAFNLAQAGNTGIRRIINATFFSLSGLKIAWRNEAAFRQECALAMILLPTAVWLGRNAVERSLLIGTCLLVLIIELLNTAVESVVDRVGMDHHELSGRAKDLGSAAVLVSLLLTVIVWGLIAWDRFGG